MLGAGEVRRGYQFIIFLIGRLANAAVRNVPGWQNLMLQYEMRQEVVASDVLVFGCYCQTLRLALHLLVGCYCQTSRLGLYLLVGCYCQILRLALHFLVGCYCPAMRLGLHILVGCYCPAMRLGLDLVVCCYCPTMRGLLKGMWL